MLEEATRLLTRWPETAVSDVDALRKLPPSLPVSRVSDGVIALLRGSAIKMRSAQVESAVLRAKLLEQ